MIYIDQELEFMKDVDAMSKMDTDQKESTNTVYDQRNGVRCIRYDIYQEMAIFKDLLLLNIYARTSVHKLCFTTH